MTTIRKRQEERRRQKLEDVQRQIRGGSLTVRKMTPAERASAETSRRDAQAARRAKSHR